MPNWVTSKVKAPSHVISAMLNENGDVDFSRVIAFEGVWPWDSVCLGAETAAEVVTKKPLSDHPLIAQLEFSNRADASIDKLSDESFEQFIQMLRNYRKCGEFHVMDFARKHWGTKWNACEPVADVMTGTAAFETAWSCPKPVLEALSKRFPEDAIEVQYADGDIGSNCGAFTIMAGEYIASDIAPPWDDQSDEDKAKWKAFAYALKGWNSDDHECESEGAA